MIAMKGKVKRGEGRDNKSGRVVHITYQRKGVGCGNHQGGWNSCGVFGEGLYVSTGPIVMGSLFERQSLEDGHFYPSLSLYLLKRGRKLSPNDCS